MKPIRGFGLSAIGLSISIFSLACTTSTPAPKPVVAAPALVMAPAAAARDAAEFRKELEQAYAQIAARVDQPVASVPAADIEAAVSMPIPDHKTIRGAVNLFTTDMRGDIQTYLTRSAKYKKQIEKALADQNLPKGLAYLPVIESGYATTLTSRSGAHGIWQFMPDTAREYGLRVDWWVDERADPERSTRAAAAYLRDLYRQFNDWPLVLAAYNAGPGRIRRAMNDTGASTFWELLEESAVPKETRGYVPTFFATITIASDPASFGFKLAPPTDPDDQRVEVEGPLSLKTVAEAAKVGEALLRELNPAFRRGLVPPGKAIVHVPAKAADLLAARATTLKNEDENIAVCSFVLRAGDSIRRIARAIGTTPETLLAMNNLRSAERVGEGDAVYLPVRARQLGTLLAQANDDVFYAVHKGDTLYSIARKNGLTVEELRELNDLEHGHSLRVGE
ncbi:MAG TPA: transglycosylase SLT domain-containing protein, partial [Thermoanaerobaculia bacterium]|nr:transglycosylase SLT domain-containing protein [Thermoanaerobaculia bacterium]